MRLAAPASTLVTVGDGAADAATMSSRVDPEGARRMMDILINLYADRRLAVVREYVSNAVDATRAAGSTDPVRVTSPTGLEPNLIVADNGVGMTAAEVEAVFLAFAASTKRDSNDLIGGLGVGAKSALTLSESFLIDTVKGGRRTLVRAARDLTHTVLLADAASELPTGTTITIGVDTGADTGAWDRVIAEVASAHPEGTVLVDGQPVPSMAGGPQWIGPVSCRGAGDHRPAVTILSGGTLFDSVPEIARDVLEHTRLQSVIVELPIGSFDHTPSRESIVATERTTAAVRNALAQFDAAYADLSDRIATLAATDICAAAELRHSILGDGTSTDLLPVPFHTVIPDGAVAWESVSRTRTGTRRWVRMECGSTMFAALSAHTTVKSTLVVTGVPVRRSLRGFATMVAARYPGARYVVAIREGSTAVDLPVVGRDDSLTGQHWPIGADTPGVTVCTFTDWQDGINSLRSPRSATSAYQTRVIAAAGEPVPAAVAMTGPELAALGVDVCYTAEEAATHGDRRLGTHPVALVYLGRRKTGPLLAAVPGAMCFHDWCKQRAAEDVASFSCVEMLAAAWTSNISWHRYSALAELILLVEPLIHPSHPAAHVVGKLVEISSVSAKFTPDQHAVIGRASRAGVLADATRSVTELADQMFAAYPLLAEMCRSNTGQPHFAAYVVHTPPVPGALTGADTTIDDLAA